jgi:hypothetical protein
MKKIWKFTIGQLPFIEYDRFVPQCTLLHAGLQDGKFCVWGIVDTLSSATQKLHLRMYTTGEAIPDSEHLSHLATVQDGPYVAHIFEVKD